jgi:putative ABC transport system permease protein
MLANGSFHNYEMRGAWTLKKIIAIFLILASAFSFAIAYIQTDNNELKKVEKAGEGIAKRFVIPADSLLSGPEETYPILEDTAVEFNVNIFRTNVSYRTNDQPEVIKYVLLTGDTRFFEAFRLKSGGLLTAEDTRQGNLFLSTANTGEYDQKGVISVFGGNHLITIKPMQNAYEYFPVYGRYYAEVTDDRAFEAFIKGLADNLNEYYQKYNPPYLFTAEDFIIDDSSAGASASAGSASNYLKYLNYAVFLIILILLIYYLFNESKRIGIIKMHGVSTMRLWFIIAGSLIAVMFVLSAVVSLFLAMSIENTTSQFVGDIVLTQFKTYIIITVLSLISCLYISRIRVSDTVKNRKDTKGIFILNTLLKVGCSVLLILIVLTIWGQYAELSVRRENLKNWEHSKDYGVFYPLTIGYDGVEEANIGLPAVMSAIDSELYPVLNRMGAVLINATLYEEEQLLADKDWAGIRSIKVNNNYLREFPVYDTHNNPVQVSEDTSDWVLLVPEKYRHREREILSFFKKSRVGFMNVEKDAYQKAVPDRVKKQQVRIIWLANDQKIFSFNPEVFPAENNDIIDPIIQVITDNNSLSADRSSILGGGATDPLKMRLIDRDTALTYKKLNPDLQRLKLDDNLKNLITVDQFIFQAIYDLQKGINQLWLISLGLLTGLLLLVVQNLIIFFQKKPV